MFLGNQKTLKLVYPKSYYMVGTRLFKSFVCHLSLIFDNTYFANYAGDNTPYTIKQTTDSLTKSLEELSISRLSSFKENKLKPFNC